MEDDNTKSKSEVLDRPRGFLTEADRKLLVGVSDIAPKSDSERQLRARIRSRIHHAILDFVLVADHLEQRDRELIFRSFADFLTWDEQRDVDSFSFRQGQPSDAASQGRALASGLSDAVTLVYEACFHHQADHPPSLFIDIIENGVKNAVPTDKNEYVGAEVTIEINRQEVDLEDVRRRYQENEPVSAGELQILLAEEPSVMFGESKEE